MKIPSSLLTKMALVTGAVSMMTHSAFTVWAQEDLVQEKPKTETVETHSKTTESSQPKVDKKKTSQEQPTHPVSPKQFDSECFACGMG